VVGSVDTSEFLVAVAASAGFLIALGTSGVQWPVVAAMLAGGLVAAPIAAFLVRVLPSVLLGAGVGGMILLTNARTVLTGLGLDGDARSVAYTLIVLAWAGAVSLAARTVLSDRRAARAGAATSARVREPAIEAA